MTSTVTSERPASAARRSSLREILPKGRTLPDELWWARHRAILIVLWVHSLAIPAYAVIRGFSLGHSVLEGLIVPAAAAFASLAQLGRRTRTVAASFGLLSSSAILVHLSGGLIEMHFHFFVMVAVVALYQDWAPFLLSIAYVLVHHGMLGALDPMSVFNHPAAWNNPWKWASIHALFIAGISAACLVTWRLNEQALMKSKLAEERLRQESHVVETLHAIGQTLAAELDLKRVVDTVTDAATRLTGAKFGAFFYNVVDEAGGSYMLYALAGAPAEAFEGFGLPRATPIFRPTFTGEGVVRLDDVTADPRYGQMPPHHGMPKGHLPVRSYLAVPVRSRTGEVIGGLFFGHPERGVFDEVDERIVVGIASQAAIAIDNARLYESERSSRLASEQAQRRLALLADVSRVVGSSLDVEAILGGVADLITASIAVGCTFDILEEDDSSRRVSRGDVASVGGQNGAAPVARVLQTGQPVRIGADGDRRVVALVAPMPARAGILGALTVTTAGHPAGTLAEDDVRLIEEIARRVAIAVENARLYARQRSVSETLQHSLLPERLPDIPGFEATSRYLPGGPDVEVGGDWYDVIQISNGSIAVAMGDVVGRGERAAALMAQLRNAVRAYAVEERSPADVVQQLNHLIFDLGSDQMATMIFGLIEPDTGTLRFVNAGHPPPFVRSADGSGSFLEGPGGVPVGALPYARYVEQVTTLEPGSTMLLYTDGLVEDRGLPLQDGLERLHRVVTEAPADLELLCDRLLATAMSGQSVQDDVAVLALRIQPLGARLSLRLPRRSGVLAPLRALIRRWLAAGGATAEETFEVLVAIGEACSNAIQHAGPAGAEFELDATIGDTVDVTVRDAGRWRPQRASGGGRGLQIMESFMDSVEITRGREGTEVRMRRALRRLQPHEVGR